MNFVIDTSAYSALQRGDEPIKQIINAAAHIYIPTIVIGELKAGFSLGSKETSNKRLLDMFIADTIVSVVNISEKTPDVFAQLYVLLRRAGRALSQDDLWIAALAAEHQLPLLTLDGDFSYIQGLELVKIRH